MAYAGAHMFLQKLNHLINCNHIPFFNNPEIICQRIQFQLLYEELGSMIQTLFINPHHDLHDLKKVSDLKKRFTDATEEAEYIVDRFLSGVHIRSHGHFHTSEDFKHSLHLDDIRISLMFIKAELKSMRIDGMKMDSSPRPQTTLNQSAAAAHSSISRGSKKLLDEIFVGIDRDAELIRDKLVEDQKKLDIVSIVGMGGIGKTTLATKVYNDGYVKHHFHVRVWVTVSQIYDKRAVLTQILESFSVQLDLENANESKLHELVHKNLMGKRYLVVIDDIWHIETWDKLKVFFPHDNNGSRILLTSRLTEVAKHVNSDGLIHHLGYLNKEKGWELLCLKVFQDNECPEWSIKPGMKIVENCHGLPLAVVVIAGVLAKEALSEEVWEEIAVRTGSYIVSDQNGCLETLTLSYNHLPRHLRECFLYLGGFPEDHKFQVQRLVWLWVAEGFIEQDGNRRLEDIAEGYLMDLVDRNLVIVADMSKSNGVVKSCILHDLVRDLCLKKAKEERFILITERPVLSPEFFDVIKQASKQVRVFANEDINMLAKLGNISNALNLRSILCYSKFGNLNNVMPKCFCSFVLLRVLDLQKCVVIDFPKGTELLVHLRYLAILIPSACFPDSICNLWNLETLILYIKGYNSVVLPSNISDLVNLRHLRCYDPIERFGGSIFILRSIERPMNLQTISNVELGDGVDNFHKCFPYIKQLHCRTYNDNHNDFKSLNYLEKLKFCSIPIRMNSTIFPATLKTLKLVGCHLEWSEMSIIQSLPNLQVLKLHERAFVGSCWNTDGQEFPQLKFLRLHRLNIKKWKAISASFPCLRHLVIRWCEDLEWIPLEIGDIPTLEIIRIWCCSNSVSKSVRRIETEQRDLGNYDLKIVIF